MQQQSNSRNKWQALKWASALISRSNSQGQDTPSCLPGLGWISHQDQVILATGPHLLQEAKNLTFNTSLMLAMVEIHLHNKRVFKAPSASPNNPGTIHLGTASLMATLLERQTTQILPLHKIFPPFFLCM